MSQGEPVGELHWPTVGLVGVPAGFAVLALAGYIWHGTVEQVEALESKVELVQKDVAEIKGDVKALVATQADLRTWLNLQFAKVQR